MFNDIIGNKCIKESLEKSIKENNLSHSYIFSGISGIGKFLFAQEFAKEITDEKNIENNADIIIINEKDNSIKTSQIKELTNSVLEKPIKSKYKIYIINNSENMTKEAQNSLLKTLEEPPEYVIIILITCNESILLNTIKSRCIKIQFNKLSDEEIREYFRINDLTLNERIIKAFDGSLEKALILNENKSYDNIENIISTIESYNELEILNLKDELFKDKDEIILTLNYIEELFLNNSKNNTKYTNEYLNCISIIENVKNRLNRNSNYDMTIDNMLLSIGEVFHVNG